MVGPLPEERAVGRVLREMDAVVPCCHPDVAYVVKIAFHLHVERALSSVDIVEAVVADDDRAVVHSPVHPSRVPGPRTRRKDRIPRVFRERTDRPEGLMPHLLLVDFSGGESAPVCSGIVHLLDPPLGVRF